MRLWRWGGGLLGSLMGVLALAAPAHAGYALQTSLGSGGFHAIQLVVADFNGDGRDDVAIVHDDPLLQDKPSVDVRLGTPSGFGASKKLTVNWGPQPAGIAVGQFGGPVGLPDTHTVDIGVVSQADGSIKFFNGNNDGTFTYMADVAGTGGVAPGAVASADTNSDGITDIAVGTDSEVRVLRGNGTFGVTEAPGSPLAMPAPVNALRLKALRAGERPSLLIGLAPASSAVASTRLAANDGGAFGNPTAISGARVVDDIDSRPRADGSLDLLVVDHDYAGALTADPQIHLLNRPDNAAAPFTEATTNGLVVTEPKRARFIDANADGASDVAVTDGTSPAQVKVFHGSSPTDFSAGPGSPFTLWSDPDTNLLEIVHVFGAADDLLAAGSFYGMTGWTSSLRALRNSYAPHLALPTGPLAVTADTGKTATTQVTVTNDGDAPLTLTGLGIAPVDGPYTVDQDQCAAAIAPGAGCQFAVVYAPTTVGDTSATLTVAAGAQNATVTIHGRATQGQTTTTTTDTTTTTPPTPPNTVPTVAPIPPAAKGFEVLFPSAVTTAGQQVILSVNAVPNTDEYTYSWDYDGDGAYDLSNSDAAQTTLRFLRAGSFQVGMLVTRVSDGVQQTATATVSVGAAPGQIIPKLAPTAEVGKAFTVDITDPAAPGSRYRFDFGDGTAPAVSRIGDLEFRNVDVSLRGRRTHTYTKAGTYSATFSQLTPTGETVTYNRTYVVTQAGRSRAATGGNTGEKPDKPDEPNRLPGVVADSKEIGLTQYGAAVSDPKANYSLGAEQQVIFHATGPYGGKDTVPSSKGASFPAVVLSIARRTGVWQQLTGGVQLSTDTANGLTSNKVGTVALLQSRAKTRGLEFTKEYNPHGYTTWTITDPNGKETLLVADDNHDLRTSLPFTFHQPGTWTVRVQWHISLHPGDPNYPVNGAWAPDFVAQHENDKLYRTMKVVVRPPLCGFFDANANLPGRTPKGLCLLPTDQDREYSLNGRGVSIAGVDYTGGVLSGLKTSGGNVHYNTISQGTVIGSVGGSGGGTVLATTSVVFYPPTETGTDLVTKNALQSSDVVKTLRAFYKVSGLPLPPELKQSTAEAKKLLGIDPSFNGVPVIDVSTIQLKRTKTSSKLLPHYVSTNVDVTVAMPEPFGPKVINVRPGDYTARAAQSGTCAASDDNYLRQSPNGTGFEMCIKRVPIVPGLITATDVSLGNSLQTLNFSPYNDGKVHSVLHGGGAITVNLGPTTHGTLDARESETISNDKDGKPQSTFYGFRVIDGKYPSIGAKLTGDPIAVGPLGINELSAEMMSGPGGRFLFRGRAGIGFPFGYEIVAINACVQIQRALKGDLVNICPKNDTEAKQHEAAANLNKNTPSGFGKIPLSQALAYYAPEAQTGFFFLGDVRVLGIKLATGYVFLTLHDPPPGQTSGAWKALIGGRFSVGLSGVLDISGQVDAQASYNPKGNGDIDKRLVDEKFAVQLFAKAEGCLFTVLCVNAQILANNLALDACVTVLFVNVGAGISFQTGSIHVFGGLGACDLKAREEAFPELTELRAGPWVDKLGPVDGRPSPGTPPVPGKATLRSGMAAFVPQQKDDRSLVLRAGTTHIAGEVIADGKPYCAPLKAAPDAASTAIVGRGVDLPPFAGIDLYRKGTKIDSLRIKDYASDGYSYNHGESKYVSGTRVYPGKPLVNTSLENQALDLKKKYNIDGGSERKIIWIVRNPQLFDQFCIDIVGGKLNAGTDPNLYDLITADAVPAGQVKYGTVSTLQAKKASDLGVQKKNPLTKDFRAHAAASSPRKVMAFRTRVTLSRGEAVMYVSVDAAGTQQIIGVIRGPKAATDERTLEEQSRTPNTMQPQKTVEKIFQFVPADDLPGTRTIYAMVTRMGHPLARRKLGTYVAARPHYSPPGRVRVKRAKGGLTVSWTKADKAVSYRVTVKRGASKVTVDVPAPKNSMHLTTFGDLEAAKVSVASVNFKGEVTGPTRAQIKAKKKLPKRILVADAGRQRKA